MSAKKKLIGILRYVIKIKDQLNGYVKMNFNINIYEKDIIECNDKNINELENQLNDLKEKVENYLKTDKDGYETIEQFYGNVDKIKFKIVKKDDNYIYLYHNYNEFAKSVNEFTGNFKLDNVKKIEFIIKNKTDKLTFDEIISNISDNIATNCPLIDIIKDTYFLSLKGKDKDSKDIYYKYNVSTNRDFVFDENGYLFNFKDGKLGDYFYDPKTKQLGSIDEEGNMVLGTQSVRREGNWLNNFLEGE